MRSASPSVLRGVIVFIVVCAWGLLLPSYYYLSALFRRPGLENIPMQFHRGLCKILGLQPNTIGTMSTREPTLYVSNHISYLDVFVLGGIIPGYFIAKSEVARWPLLGRLARVQKTLFFERNRGRAKEQIAQMQEHLRTRGNLILFPEGTSTDGAHVQGFKSSLFAAAQAPDSENDSDANEVWIQPVTVSYVSIDKQLIDQSTRNFFSWFDPTPFVLHYFRVMGMPTVEVQVLFSEPVLASDFASRKQCAMHCEEQVRKRLAESLSS